MFNTLWFVYNCFSNIVFYFYVRKYLTYIKHTLAAHPLPQCAALDTVLQRQPPHTPRAHAGERLSGMHIHAILTVKNFDNANLRNRKRNLPETVSPAPEKPFPQQRKVPRATSVTVSRRRKGSFVSPYSLIRAAEKHVPRSRKGFPASPDGLFRDGIKACLRCGKAHTSDCQPLTQSAQKSAYLRPTAPLGANKKLSSGYGE